MTLKSGATELGISLSQNQLQQFARYTELLIQWNKVMNLTRVPVDQFVTLHFLDSLSAVSTFDPPGKHLIDVGTGAGFPGVPLKIAFPNLQVTLLDSTRKRLDFLEAVCQDLQLEGVNVLHSRAEEAGRNPTFRGKFDVVTARAVSRLNALAEYLLPLARVGGTIIAMKSADSEEEIVEAQKIIRDLGGDLVKTMAVTLPGTDIERRLILIRKARPTPPQYPRDSSIINRKAK